MKSIGSLLLVLLFSIQLISQDWAPVDGQAVITRGERNIIPNKYITAYVDDASIKDILWKAPQELDFDPSKDQPVLLNVMMADGSFDQFSIVQYQMMEPGLASRYPDIRTFHGTSATDPSRRIRINYTVHGLRAVITDVDGQTYIDHLQRNDKNHKIIYKRNDFAANEDWKCDYQEEKLDIKDDSGVANSNRSGDCNFRSYRFSITATGEYSNYHGATSAANSALVLSAIVTTVDRVNDIFEQDLTMRLILISNVDDVFYYNSATDPFSGTSSGSMINENQTNTDAVIGSANYDLGHIVSTGGSGLAGLGVICSNGNKARGVTGISTPEGDPFDIDYVAHEIGHQLGANHTQNNSCNRNTSTAMEPGSASTIMGYAGICAPNVQNNSDAYFHAISIQEMNGELTSNSCHQIIALSNSAPVVNPLTNKSIPHSTPFVLDAVATDPDGDALTYNWEQMDNEVGTMPPQGTNTQGPMFRSKFATLDSKRYFPNITNVIAGTTDQWEVLPTVNRNMDFRVTVRDNSIAPGCTDEQDITLDVEGSAGPFIVTSQNTATTWLESESVTITWDVANTVAAPVSCNNVELLLSYDGGLTYPTVLLASTPNDGSAVINVPLGTTTTARVMVKCSDNVFFDINNTNIVINNGSPSFSLTTSPTSGSICDDLPITFTLESTSILGFTNPVTLTLSDLPTGATTNITTNPITPGSNTAIQIDNLDGQSGIFNVKITGVSGSITKETFYSLTVENSVATPVLMSPLNASTGAVANPTLSWNSVAGASNYEYEISTLPSGGNVINSGNTTSTSVIVNPSLNLSTTYYWRVRSTNNCGVTPWSNDWTFETGTCIIKSANDLPIAISATSTPTINSTFNIIDRGIISDLNIVALAGTHTYISDLNFTMILPDGTSTAFWSDPCTFQDNFDINFDDEAANNNYPCPPTDGMTYQPDNPLSIFDTKQIQGDWTLSVFDDFNEDGGTLVSWGVEICLDSYCDITVNDNAFTNNYGTLLSALNCAIDGDTIYLESAIAGMTIDAGSASMLIDKNITILAQGNDIKIISNGTAPTFVIDDRKNVTFIGFNVENLSSTGGVIENNGQLTLRDIEVKSGLDEITVKNHNSAKMTIEGDCKFIDN